MNLDLEFVRSQFPAFREPSLAGFAHFENAGGSYACGQTIDWLDRYYRQTKVQPYYAFAASAQAGEQMDAARARMAAWLNVGTGRNPFRPFDLAEHIRARAGAAALPEARRRDHRHQPGPRGERRRLPPPRGRRHRRCANGRSIPRPPSSNARTSRRCSARARSSSRSRTARTSSAASTRCASSPTSPTGPAPGPSWTASRSRRTACPDVRRARRRCLLFLPLQGVRPAPRGDVPAARGQRGAAEPGAFLQ